MGKGAGGHGNATKALGLHGPVTWDFANAADRIAFTVAEGRPSTLADLDADDIGKWAEQLDDGSIWKLTAITPTWVQVINPISVGLGTVTVADIADPSAEMNGLAGAAEGDLLIATQVVPAGANFITTYAWDVSPAASGENVPYTVDGAGGGRWQATGGRFVNQVIESAADENRIRFFFSAFASLPSASAFRGMLAYVHEVTDKLLGQSAYFGHSTLWQMLKDHRQDDVAALTPAASVEIDFGKSALTYQTLTLGVSTTLTEVNAIAGVERWLSIVSGASGRTLTFPSNWAVFGTYDDSGAPNLIRVVCTSPTVGEIQTEAGGGGAAPAATYIATIQNAKTSAGAQASGLSDAVAGLLTVNGGDPSRLDIKDSFGQIQNLVTPNGAPTPVSWSGLSNLAVPTIGGGAGFTHVYVDAAGSPVFESLPLTGPKYRSQILLGILLHSGGTVIEDILTVPVLSYGTEGDLVDLYQEMGDRVRRGNVYSAAGANKLLNKSEGPVFGRKINVLGSPLEPNKVTSAAQVSITPYAYTRGDGAGGWIQAIVELDLDPDFYDDGSAVLAAVPAGKFTAQPIQFDARSGRPVLHYGQKLYNSLDEAQDGINQNGVRSNPVFDLLPLTTWVIAEGGTAAYSDTSKARFPDPLRHAVSPTGTAAADRNSRTGLLQLAAGILSINGGDNTKVDIAPVALKIVDDTTEPPTTTNVNFAGVTALTVDNLLTAPTSSFFINAAGAVVQETGRLDGADRRAMAFLGFALHQGMTVIEAVGNNGIRVAGHASSVDDIMQSLGDRSEEGNIYSANGANNLLDRAPGVFFGANIGPLTNPNFKSLIASIGITSYLQTYQPVTPGDPFASSFVAAIEPNSWDDGTGVKGTVGNNKWTIKRLLFDPRTEINIVELGQIEYNSLADAVDGVSQNGIAKNPLLSGLVLLGWLLVKQGTSDLSAAANAKFVENSGEVAQGSGSGVDPNAIHVNVAGEIAAISLATIAADDKIVFEDTSNSDNKKHGTVQGILDLAGGGLQYTVGPPSAGAKYATITAAIAAAIANTPETVIIVLPGVYTESFTLPSGLSLTGLTGRSARTTVIGDITMLGTASTEHAISNVRIEGDVLVQGTSQLVLWLRGVDVEGELDATNTNGGTTIVMDADTRIQNSGVGNVCFRSVGAGLDCRDGALLHADVAEAAIITSGNVFAQGLRTNGRIEWSGGSFSMSGDASQLVAEGAALQKTGGGGTAFLIGGNLANTAGGVPVSGFSGADLFVSNVVTGFGTARIPSTQGTPLDTISNALFETGGANLPIGAVADGQLLARSGSSIVGVSGGGAQGWAYFHTPDANIHRFQHRVIVLGPTSGWNFSCRIPRDMGTLTKLVLIIDFTGPVVGPGVWNVAANYGKNLEAVDNTMESGIVGGVSSLGSYTFAEVDLLGVATGVEPGDQIGFNVDADTGLGQWEAHGIYMEYDFL